MKYPNLTARDAAELIDGPGRAAADTLAALVRAEKYGRGTVHGATIECAGYVPDAAGFSAATALYRVTW